jgi:tetratricopeptide (TPR) repeat protein
MNQAQELHKKAEEAREKEDFLAALKYTDEALLAFSDAKDSLGFAEILASRFLTLRHLFEQTGDKNFMILAKQDVLASVEIARKSGNAKALAMPLFNLGKAYETLKEFGKAVESFKEALENMKSNPPEDHGGDAEIAEMTIHLSFVQYKTNDKQALERLELAIDALSKAEEDKYKKDVWLSGGLMDLADALKNDNPIKAKEALEKAREIINANPDLTLRKKQFAKLEATFNS